MLALGTPERAYLDAYLVSETGPEDALAAVSRLRSDGLRVDFDVEGRSVKAQFRTAGRIEAPVVLVWKGEGVPVDVQTGEERSQIPLEEVSSWFSNR